jgi:NADH-quinone oxidoreductase subunit L
VTHAFFKACLFLGAGSVIHALHHEQDLRKMGGLRTKLPATFRTMLIAGLSMAGVAPLAGFVSKDEILWKAWEHGGVGRVAWVLGSIAALCTAFYTGRLLLMAFGGDYRGAAPSHGHDHGHGHDDHGHHAIAYNDIHQSPKAMTLPLVLLSLGAAFLGFLGGPTSSAATTCSVSGSRPS